VTDLQEALKSTAAAVTRQLDELLPKGAGPRGRVVEAMRYACLGGGKRLRPFLTVASARLFDVRDPRALRVAAAIEMVHCYSLVHDDLPAMDDSDLRRGQPTVHRKFDHATAVLAGDGLLTEAFAVLSEPATHKDPQVRTDLVRGLSEAAGARGMVGGQQVDISPERDDLDLDGVTQLQRMKTGALITFSCEAGAILGGADDQARQALRGYARDLGLAFQIADDLLDAEGTSAELGKPAGQDAAAGKATFVNLMGARRARRRAQELVESAQDQLEPFGDKADLLRQTAEFVVSRRS
jgi:farnesyl diphosphate synthase